MNPDPIREPEEPPEKPGSPPEPSPPPPPGEPPGVPSGPIPPPPSRRPRCPPRYLGSGGTRNAATFSTIMTAAKDTNPIPTAVPR
jgi:hypothetical protein